MVLPTSASSTRHATSKTPIQKMIIFLKSSITRFKIRRMNQLEAFPRTFQNHLLLKRRPWTQNLTIQMKAKPTRLLHCMRTILVTKTSINQTQTSNLINNQDKMEIKSRSPITITRLTTTINLASNLMTAFMKTNSSLRNQIQTSPPTALLIITNQTQTC